MATAVYAYVLLHAGFRTNRYPIEREEGRSNSAASWRAPEGMALASVPTNDLIDPNPQHVNSTERVNTVPRSNSSNTVYQPPIPALQAEGKNTHDTKATQTPSTYQNGAFKAYDRRDNKQVPEKEEKEEEEEEIDKPAPRKQNAWGVNTTTAPKAWSSTGTNTATPNVWESKRAALAASSEPTPTLDDAPLLPPINHENPRVMLRYLVSKLVHSKLISKEVENALEEYIHSQKIKQQDKEICTMEEPQQVDALNSIGNTHLALVDDSFSCS